MTDVDLLECAETIEGIRKGLDDVKQKRTKSLDEFVNRLKEIQCDNQSLIMRISS